MTWNPDFATEELSRVAATAVDTDNGIVTEAASANPSEHQPSEDPALSAHLAQQSHEEDPAPSSNMSLCADPVPPAKATISDIPEASQDAGASGSATSPYMVGTEASNQRPTHSGKSLELLGLAGVKVTRRVNLKMGRSRRDDGDEYEDSGVEGSADEMEVDSEPKEKQSRPPRKKRRIVSAATIGSEEEPAPKGPKRKPKADQERKDKWPTYVSRPRCSRCMRSGLRCRSFVLPQRGPPRFTCEHCHQRKQQCPLTAPRRLAYSQGQLLDGGELSMDVDEEEETPAPVASKRKPQRVSERGEGTEKKKGKGKAKESRKGKGKRKEVEQVEVIEKGKGKGARKGKDKGKGKAKAVEEEEDGEEKVVKVEDDDEEVEWTTGK